MLFWDEGGQLDVQFSAQKSYAKFSQVTRTGDRPIPSTFSLSDDALEGLSAGSAEGIPSSRASSVSCVAYHPLVPTLFLAGFDDGRVALFVTSHALPLLAWPAPWARVANSAKSPSQSRQRSVVPVVRVAWVPGRPAAFVAVDADGWLGAWDILSSTVSALSSVRITDGNVVSVDVGGATVLARTVVTVLVVSTLGIVEVALNPEFVSPNAGEMRALRALISRRHF
jgi:hypothetical protein